MERNNFEQFQIANETDVWTSFDASQPSSHNIWGRFVIVLLLSLIVFSSTQKLYLSLSDEKPQTKPIKKVRFECDLEGEKSESVKDQLEGTWHLISYRLELKSPVRFTTYPLGKHAIGRLTYTSDGYMSVHVMRPGCKPFRTENPQGGNVQENSRATAHYMAYAGRYQTFECKGQKLVHHLIDKSLYPNWLETTQARVCDFDGDELVLRPKKMPTFMVIDHSIPARLNLLTHYQGMEVGGILRWRRASVADACELRNGKTRIAADEYIPVAAFDEDPAMELLIR